MAKILVVNSDASARRLLLRRLTAGGHNVIDAADARAAFDAMARICPDLVVCDSRLDDRNGIDLLRNIRRDDTLKAIRVLMMADGAGIGEAFDAGADDVIRQPVDVHELRARVAECLRRAPDFLQAESVSSSGITIDNVSKRLVVDGQPVSVAPREYRLLLFFLMNPDRVFTREQLLASVWNQDVSVGARTVDVHIRRLRGLLEASGYDRHLQTVRGSGYRYSLTP